MIKPRIYWTYYPKSKRGYWRVSVMPWAPTSQQSTMWALAHRAVMRANTEIGNAKDAAPHAIRSAH